MLEVNVALEFYCCHCHQDLTVKLKCSGPGLQAGLHQAAAVRIPCPHCDCINQVYFEPSGLLLGVNPLQRPILEPSLN